MSTRSGKRWPALAIVVAALAVSCSDAAAQILDFTVEQLTDNDLIDSDPQISGDNVVWWRSLGATSSTREIMFYDGSTVQQVTDNDFFDMDPQISGNNVTWWGQTGSTADTREIFFWNGTTITQVTNDMVRDEAPQIHGDTVAWVRGTGFDLEIFGYTGGAPFSVSNSPGVADSSPNVSSGGVVYKSGSSPTIGIWRNDGITNAPVSALGFNKANPHADGDRVVWEQIEGDWEIYYYDGTTAVPLTDNDFNDFQPHVSGNNVVWRGGTFPNIEIYFYDGSTVTQVTNNDFTDFNPVIDGNIIAWQGSDGSDMEIFAWDGDTIFQLTDNDFDDTMPQISGNKIVWQALAKGSGDGLEIFQATLVFIPEPSAVLLAALALAALASMAPRARRR